VVLSANKKKLPCGGTAEEPHGFCGPHESELVQHVSEWHMRCSTASLHKALGEHTLRKDNKLKNIKITVLSNKKLHS